MNAGAKRLAARIRDAIGRATTDQEREALIAVLEKILEQLPALDDSFYNDLEKTLEAK